MWPFSKKEKPARNYFVGTVYKMPPKHEHLYCCILDDLWYYYTANIPWTVVPPELHDLKLEGGNWQLCETIDRLPEDAILLDEIDMDNFTSLDKICGDTVGHYLENDEFEDIAAQIEATYEIQD